MSKTYIAELRNAQAGASNTARMSFSFATNATTPVQTVIAGRIVSFLSRVGPFLCATGTELVGISVRDDAPGSVSLDVPFPGGEHDNNRLNENDSTPGYTTYAQLGVASPNSIAMAGASWAIGRKGVDAGVGRQNIGRVFLPFIQRDTVTVAGTPNPTHAAFIEQAYYHYIVGGTLHGTLQKSADSLTTVTAVAPVLNHVVSGRDAITPAVEIVRMSPFLTAMKSRRK